MNNFGEAHRLLEALAQCNDELRSFGYSLYIQHQKRGWVGSWTRNNINVSGTPFTFHKETGDEVYQRCFVLGVGIQASPSLCLNFGIYFCWDKEVWMVRADVDFTDDSQNDENYYVHLWSFQSKTSDVDEAIVLLHTATQNIIDYGKAEDFSHLVEKVRTHEPSF